MNKKNYFIDLFVSCLFVCLFFFGVYFSKVLRQHGQEFKQTIFHSNFYLRNFCLLNKGRWSQLCFAVNTSKIIYTKFLVLFSKNFGDSPKNRCFVRIHNDRKNMLQKTRKEILLYIFLITLPKDVYIAPSDLNFLHSIRVWCLPARSLL